jgi:hypothetical protein
MMKCETSLALVFLFGHLASNVSSESAFGNSTFGTVLKPSAELLKDLIERHQVLPDDKRADPAYPRIRNAELIENSCRAELDGYFGSATGKPIGLQYGVTIETVANGNIKAALVVIEDLVSDTILAQAFPSVCSLHQRRMQQVASDADQPHVSGFRFYSFANTTGMYHIRCHMFIHVEKLILSMCIDIRNINFRKL